MKTKMISAVAFMATAIFLITISISACSGNSKNPPNWVEWKEKELAVATEGMTKLVLSNQSVQAKCDDLVVWESETFYKVSDFLWEDVDKDDEAELIMLLWKTGEGSLTTDEGGQYRQHLYIYDWNPKEKSMEQRWMASDLGMDVEEMRYDLDSHNLWLKTVSGESSCWTWNDWGLEYLDMDVRLVAVGDNLMHRPLYERGIENGNFDFLYSHVKSEISKADIAIVNQETPFVIEPYKYSSYPRFGTPCEVASALTNAGFDIASCATNHMLDQGLDGVNCTKEYMDKAGIKTVGIIDNNPVAYSVNSARIALFNYTQSTNGIPLPEEAPNAVSLLNDEDRISSELAQARKDYDIVIVCVHWGTEYEKDIDENQKKWTEVFLNSDVDLVIGSHPHVVSDYEMLTSSNGHQMLVYYSLGNFASAQNKIDTVFGGMADVTFKRGESGYEIAAFSMRDTVMHQSTDAYTVYFLDEYPEILAKQHVVPEVYEKIISNGGK